MADSFSRFATTLLRSAEVLVEVQADRLRMSVLQGLCEGLAVLWGGRVWLGNLSGGLLALLLVAGTTALALRLNARGTLARLASKYERIRSPDDTEPEASPSAQVDRGAPRS